MNVKRGDILSREFLNNILESLEGGVLTVDKNLKITSFNCAAEEITGYKKEEVLGRECCFILKSDLCDLHCPFADIYETGKTVYNYEIQITNKDGEKIPVNITTSALRSSDNKIIGGIENFRDLTKHEGLWGKLRQERNMAQQYLNIAGVIIVAINEKGLVTLINKKGCDVLGYEEYEIIGRNWFDLCLPERIQKEIKGVFERLMNGKNDFVDYHENSILTKSGEERMIAWHNTILTDEKGANIGTLSSGEDITKRKQTEMELIRSEKLASLGQLAASVAHEVNNPLAGILVYTSLLLRKYEQNTIQSEDTKNQLHKMKKELERTTRIIRNLLDFSRQSDPSIRLLDVNKVVEAALLLVKHQISLEHISLKIELKEDLPSVFADFDQIQQVMINIILNATQAMPDGGSLTITTSIAKGTVISESKKDAVRIDIKDTGVGIPKENLSRLFTPFFTTKERGKGVGLGLPVVHGIIERHKGKIEVSSDLNMGTTFSIFLETGDEATTP